MNSVRIKAKAKLNLTLNITGRDGGYHMLDSIVTQVDLYDLIKIKKRRDGLVGITMHGMGSEEIPFEKNNAVLAAERYIKRFETCGVEITVFKNIPMGAGLGGSSADAAGTLLGLSRLFGKGSLEELKEIADGIGSDVGYMLTGGYARMLGRGDKVLGIESKLKLDFLLLVPKTPVNTAECYKKFDSIGTLSDRDDGAVAALMSGDIREFAKHINNSLTEAATSLNGEIDGELKNLAAFDPLAYNMTGSGSAVYALFENREFCTYAKSRYRGRAAAYCIKNY